MLSVSTSVVKFFFPVLDAVQGHLNQWQNCQNIVNNLMKDALIIEHNNFCAQKDIDLVRLLSSQSKQKDDFSVATGRTVDGLYTFVHLNNNQCSLKTVKKVKNYDSQLIENMRRVLAVGNGECLDSIVTFPDYAHTVNKDFLVDIANVLMENECSKATPSADKLHRWYDAVKTVSADASTKMMRNLYKKCPEWTVEF